MLQIAQVRYHPESADHDLAITALADEAFGPGRFVRAAERVREMTPHDRSLSFVALVGAGIVGSVRQTPVMIGATPAYVLGPLVVRPTHKGLGIGRHLMRMAADAAREAGERIIVLVGDRAYYMPLGYQPLPEGRVILPGPVDWRRVLGLPLVDGALEGLGGTIRAR